MRVAGFGFRLGASIDSLQNAYDKARGNVEADAIATLAEKSSSSKFGAFADGLGLPISAEPLEELQKQQTPTHSDAAFEKYGVGSMAEAAALSAAGDGAMLLGARVVSDDQMATCALAEGVSK